MPRKGFKSIAVKQEIHEIAKENAETSGKTLGKYVEDLIDSDALNTVLQEVPILE